MGPYPANCRRALGRGFPSLESTDRSSSGKKGERGGRKLLNPCSFLCVSVRFSVFCAFLCCSVRFCVFVRVCVRFSMNFRGLPRPAPPARASARFCGAVIAKATVNAWRPLASAKATPPLVGCEFPRTVGSRPLPFAAVPRLTGGDSNGPAGVRARKTHEEDQGTCCPAD